MTELFYTVPAAIGLGALHALEPGHGKGVISAYLVATHGKIRDAIMIGIISAVTHTLSIILMSFIASSAIEQFASEQASRWIELIAGLLIVLIGARMMIRLYFPRIVSVGKLSELRHLGSSHEHDHGAHHHHHHFTDGVPKTLPQLATIGIFTGMIPCPSALAVFLAAIAADQISLGIGLVSAFSLGTAISMCTVGILVVRLGKLIKQQGKRGLLQSLQYASSFLIVGIGLIVVLQSF